MKKLLVIGIGNILLTDDGVGIFAAQELMHEQWPQNITITEVGTCTHDMFYIFEGFTSVIVLDIVHAKGTPGSLYTLNEEALVINKNQRLSIHDVDFIDSLRMADLLFGTRPSIRILGVEPWDYTTWNIGLSDKITEVFPNYMHLVRKEIENWIEYSKQ